MPGVDLGPTTENYLPAQYNSDSNLGADVKNEGANTFDFTLKSK